MDRASERVVLRADCVTSQSRDELLLQWTAEYGVGQSALRSLKRFRSELKRGLQRDSSALTQQTGSG